MTPYAAWRPAIGERLVLTTLLAGLALLLVHQDWLWRWDRLFYDAQLQLWQRPPADDIVIVAIDEATLQEFGRWPWPRNVHAHLLRVLGEAQARAVAFDVIFAEPDLQDPDSDSDFARSISDHARVVLPVMMEQRSIGGQPVETLPLPALANSAAAMGHVHVELDPDGIARGLYLYEGLGGPHWPHLALQLMKVAGESPPDPRSHLADSESGSPMVWFRARRLLIPFAGPPGHFKHISYGQVMQHDFAAGTFRDKYVLIGTTAAGLGDALPTPVSGFSHSMSGVEINANILDALRRGLIISPLADGWRMALSAVLAVLPLLIFPKRAPRTNLLVTALLLVLVLALSGVLLIGMQRWFPPAAALVCIALSYPLWSWRRLELAMRYLSQELDRLQHQQSDITTAGNPAIADAMAFLSTILPLRGWQLIDPNGTGSTGAGEPPTPPPLTVREGDWVEEGDCAWTRVSANGLSCQLGLRWDTGRAPEENERQLLNQLFELAEPASTQGEIRAEKDLQARIHQVQQATLQLRELRRFIDDSLANMADGVVVASSFGEVLLANARAAWYLKGDDNASLVRQPVMDLLSDLVPDQGADWQDLLRRAILERIRLQSGARHRNGRDLLVQIAPLNRSMTELSGIIINFSDISLLKASERKRNELLNFLSHDLRSPLVSMSALIDLARGHKPDTAVSTLLDRMQTHTGNTLELAEQFLQLARAESSDPFNFSEVEFTGVALNALEQVWGQAQQHRIGLAHEFDVGDQAWVCGDGGLLERSLVNLLDNAIKYSADGGEVRVTVQRVDGMLMCCVEDQGRGIPAAEIPHLFERFHRVRDTQVERQRGAGLGLAFVDVVVQRHGGRMEVNSVEGEGSRFCMLLPEDNAAAQLAGD